MASFLITFKPASENRERGWPLEKLQRLARRLHRGYAVQQKWRFRNKDAALGDRVFLLLQGQRGPAIIGYGRVNRKAHRNDAGELVASVKFESLVDPSIEVLAGTDKLLAIGGRQGVWRTPFSGVRLQDKIAAKLEALVVTGMVSDDTYDDLGIDPSLLGSDGAPRFVMKKSGVKRDPAVRREVIRRATNGCEHSSCADDRRYSGFLDVHHILGAEESDRVWTCVALCPNCHRAAHYAPECDALNAELLEFASQFRPATRPSHPS
jgi:5-methylcytosine-specific restriction protein A